MPLAKDTEDQQPRDELAGEHTDVFARAVANALFERAEEEQELYKASEEAPELCKLTTGLVKHY